LPHLIELREIDSGHCAPLECPDEVTAALRDWPRGRREAAEARRLGGAV
jgi:pimeloyl-ACP methyl ester carboxylesterase